MSTQSVKINGVVRGTEFSSFSISEQVNGRGSLSCTILDTLGRPASSGIVEAFEDSTLIFKGPIDVPTERGFGGIGWATYETRLSVVSNDAYADFRFVFLTLAAGTTVHDCAATLAPYLTPYGISLDPAQAVGPALTQDVPLDGVLLSDALNTLTAAFGNEWVWEIGYDDRFRIFKAADHAAPFDIVDGDGNVIGDIEVEQPDSDFGNRIILRFSAAARSAYAFLGPASNFADGNEVVVGGQTYTFQAVLTDESGNVLIGAGANDSSWNLIQAINGESGGAGIVYAASTPKNSSVAAHMPVSGGIVAVAITPGAAGNNIVVSSTKIDAQWFGEGNIPLATLELGADAALVNKVQADDAASQAPPPAGRGLRERLVDEPLVFDEGLAQLLANVRLAQALARPKRISYVTYQKNIHPGMTQQITSTMRNLSGFFFITEVEIFREGADGDLRRKVSATGGLTLPELWQDVAKQVFAKGGSGSASLTGAGASVTIVNAAGAGRQWFGGSRLEWVRSPTPTWVDATGVLIPIDSNVRGFTTGTVSVQIRAADAGVSVQVRLWDSLNNRSAGASAVYTTTVMALISFPVLLSTGPGFYSLQVLPSVANADVQAMGFLE